MPAWYGPTAAQSGLKWNRPSDDGKPSRKCDASKLSAQSTQPRRRLFPASLARGAQGGVEQFDGAHAEARLQGAQPLGQLADQLVIVAALLVAGEHGGPDRQMRVTEAVVDVVVFEEH